MRSSVLLCFLLLDLTISAIMGFCGLHEIERRNFVLGRLWKADSDTSRTRRVPLLPSLILRGGGSSSSQERTEETTSSEDFTVLKKEDTQQATDYFKISADREKQVQAKLSEMKDFDQKAAEERKRRIDMAVKHAQDVIENITGGYTMYGDPPAEQADPMLENLTVYDPWRHDPYQSSLAFYENRPVLINSLQEDYDNSSKTRLLPPGELSWYLPDGSIAPQYGNAPGQMGFGTRSVGVDEIAQGLLYTNESYEPDAQWRKDDEEFLRRIKEERKAFGDDWYRFLPEEFEEYEDEKKIEQGETIDNFNFEMLDCAVQGDNIRLREWVAKGADPDAIDTRVEYPENGEAHGSFRAVHYATMFGHRRTIEWLHAYGADMNARNYIQETPLHLAATGDHLDCVKALLNMGCSVNAVDANGWTPLFKAVLWKATDELIITLVKAGADLDMLDDLGRAPIDVANKWNRTETMELLLSLGAKPAHVPGTYCGSAAELQGCIWEGAKVVLSEAARDVLNLPKRKEVIEQKMLGKWGFGPIFERDEDYGTYLDALNISDLQYKRLQEKFADAHDGPLYPGIVGTVVKCDHEWRQNGKGYSLMPYEVEVSFGNDPEALERWGVKVDKQDEDGLPVDQEYAEGSTNEIKWWYTAESVRLATPEEIERSKELLKQNEPAPMDDGMDLEEQD